MNLKFNKCSFPVKVFSGEKSLRGMPAELEACHLKRPMVITDSGVIKARLLRHVKKAFHNSDITIRTVYYGLSGHLTFCAVEEIISIFRHNNCDSLIAVGGGACNDAAKAVKLLLSEKPHNIPGYIFSEKNSLSKELKMLISIPTTAGSYAELSPFLIINGENEKNYIFNSYNYVSDLIFFDPVMNIGSPSASTAVNVMNIIANSIDSFLYAEMQDKKNMACRAIQLVSDYFNKMEGREPDIWSCFTLYEASCMAAISRFNLKESPLRLLSYSLAAVCHLHVGVAMSILLPHYLDLVVKKKNMPLVNLLLAFKRKDEHDIIQDNNQIDFIIGIIERMQFYLNGKCDLPLNLKQAGVRLIMLDPIRMEYIAMCDQGLITEDSTVDLQTIEELLKLAYR